MVGSRPISGGFALKLFVIVFRWFQQGMGVKNGEILAKMEVLTGMIIIVASFPRWEQLWESIVKKMMPW